MLDDGFAHRGDTLLHFMIGEPQVSGRGGQLLLINLYSCKQAADAMSGSIRLQLLSFVLGIGSSSKVTLSLKRPSIMLYYISNILRLPL